MRRYDKPLAIVLAWTCLGSQLMAQAPAQVVQRPPGPIFIRSYEPTSLPPVQLTNTPRLRALIRGGKLYLTLQDAIALAIENNLDLEVDRYGPLTAYWTLKRQKAGGPLQGVPSTNSVVNQAASGQGVAGSQQAAGLANNNNGNGNTGGNQTISQIGPITPNLDPVLQSAMGFIHRTSPQSNTTQSQTSALVDTSHVFQNVVQQGLITGGFVQVSANESYLKENAPTNNLNPSVAPVVQVYVRHNFLNSFGPSVNSRFIRVAEKNIGGARETFRSQLLNLVSNVINLYWDLVTNNDDLKVRINARDMAQKFMDDTEHQIELGVIAKTERSRAQAQLSTRKQEVAISEANVRLQENLVKDALSRNGLEDPLMDSVEIVPLDRIQVPEQDTLPGLRDLLARALAKRPDVALNKINDETQEISALGTANGILPFLQGTFATSNSGLAGVPIPGTPADPFFDGGLGTALGQIFRRNFSTNRAQYVFQGLIGNHVAQGDYGIDQLQMRQGDLTKRRSLNQIVVDISFQMTALRQARSRYSVATDGRKLQEQLLEKEQQKFQFGTSTITDLVAAQGALVAAQLAELTAQSAYSRARIALDQVLGETLETNHVSIGEALEGKVAKESKIAE